MKIQITANPFRKIANPITPWIKNAFKSKVNLILIAAWIITSALDFFTNLDLTGGIAFFGAAMLGFMLDLSRVSSKLPKILLFLVTLSLTSCLSVNRIEKNCDKFAKICVVPEKVTVIVKDSFIYRTDTILVQLPKDTAYIHDTIRIENGIAQLPKVHKKSGVISVDAWVRNSVLSVYAYLNDSTILVPFRDTITVPVTTIINDNNIVNPPQKFIPGFYKFTLWFFIFTSLAIILYILNKMLKFRIM